MNRQSELTAIHRKERKHTHEFCKRLKSKTNPVRLSLSKTLGIKKPGKNFYTERLTVAPSQIDWELEMFFRGMYHPKY